MAHAEFEEARRLHPELVEHLAPDGGRRCPRAGGGPGILGARRGARQPPVLRARRHGGHAGLTGGHARSAARPGLRVCLVGLRSTLRPRSSDRMRACTGRRRGAGRGSRRPARRPPGSTAGARGIPGQGSLRVVTSVLALIVALRGPRYRTAVSPNSWPDRIVRRSTGRCGASSSQTSAMPPVRAYTASPGSPCRTMTSPAAKRDDLYRLRDRSQGGRRHLREEPDGPQRIDFLFQALHRAPSCPQRLSPGFPGSTVEYTAREATQQ